VFVVFLLVCFKHGQIDNDCVSKKDLLIWTRKLQWSRRCSFLLLNDVWIIRSMNLSSFRHIFSKLLTLWF